MEYKTSYTNNKTTGGEKKTTKDTQRNTTKKNKQNRHKNQNPKYWITDFWLVQIISHTRL